MQANTADFAEMGRLIWNSIVCTKQNRSFTFDNIIKPYLLHSFESNVMSYLTVPTNSSYGQTEVKGYYFRRDNFSILSFVPFVNGSQLLKKRICSYRSKFFSSRVDPLGTKFSLKSRPYFERSSSTMEDLRNSPLIFPLYNTDRKTWSWSQSP